jgi:hypothetical protein
MRGLRWLYRGPRAWLIWLNLVISCAAVIPLLIGVLLQILSKLRGDWVAIPTWFGLVMLLEVAHIGYVACLPPVLSVCILLLTPRIPWRVKLATAAVEAAVCAALFWDISLLKVQFKNGLLG